MDSDFARRELSAPAGFIVCFQTGLYMPRNPSGSCGGFTTTLHGGFDRKGHRNSWSPSNYLPSCCCLDSHLHHLLPAVGV